MYQTPNYTRFAPMTWDLDSISKNPALVHKRLAVAPKALSRCLPTRVLRYWFMYQFLRNEFSRQGANLHVCEAGIDKGQLLQFVRGADEIVGNAALGIADWVGVDCALNENALSKLGYSALHTADIEKSAEWLKPETNVVILLHVLEHLFEPEHALANIAERLQRGAIVMGGFPSLPQWLAIPREKKIRANPNANGHVSTFSPGRVYSMAANAGLAVEYLTGAFCLRMSGSVLEDHPWWLRFNLAFGALVPMWPGECYWVMRKPA